MGGQWQQRKKISAQLCVALQHYQQGGINKVLVLKEKRKESHNQPAVIGPNTAL